MSFTTDKEVVELYPCNKSIHTLCVENEEKMVFGHPQQPSIKMLQRSAEQLRANCAHGCVCFEWSSTAPVLRVNGIL